MAGRIVGALETVCRQGEMLKIQNHHIEWDRHRILIPAENTKDDESRRIPFEPGGRLAYVLERRRFLGPRGFVFGLADGTSINISRTAWESLLLIANGVTPKSASEKSETLQSIDLRWHDLRREVASRWLDQGIDLRTIRLLLGHSSVLTTQRYLSVTDDEMLRLMREKRGSKKTKQAGPFCSVSRLSAYMKDGLRLFAVTR